MQKRHENYITPESVVFSLVKKTTRKEPLEREKIVRGYDNEVYLVRTKGGEDLIVRIKRFGEVSFQQEAWAMTQCREADVPVPDLFLVDKISLDNQNLEVMITSRVNGQPLDICLKNLSSDDLRKTLIRAGEVLGKIHSIKVGGFYLLREEGRWDFSDWESVMNSTITNRSKEKDLILSAGFTDTDFDFMIQMLEKYKKDFSNQTPVLNHGDYLPEHIFVNDDLQISGVIDFGSSQGASPVHDFAYFNFEEPSLDLESLKEGYGNKTLFDDSFNMQLNLEKLALEMGHLAHSKRVGDTNRTKIIAKELDKTIKIIGKFN